MSLNRTKVISLVGVVLLATMFIPAMDVCLADDGIEIHPDVIDKATDGALKFKPENETLRNSILRVEYDSESKDLFRYRNVELRQPPTDDKAFEPAWRDFREGKIYDS